MIQERPVVSDAGRSTLTPRDVRHLNNFDLIRLAAAAQVMIGHTMRWMHTSIAQPALAAIFGVTAFTPGGFSVFFVISGFLITKSFASRPDDLGRYVRNRALRLYPGLWAALAVSLTCMIVLGGFAVHFIGTPKFFAWFAEEALFPLGYTPQFLRGYGVGVPNGSLWSIPVEMQFYALVPIFYAHWSPTLLKSPRWHPNRDGGRLFCPLLLADNPLFNARQSRRRDFSAASMDVHSRNDDLSALGQAEAVYGGKGPSVAGRIPHSAVLPLQVEHCSPYVYLGSCLGIRGHFARPQRQVSIVETALWVRYLL